MNAKTEWGTSAFLPVPDPATHDFSRECSYAEVTGNTCRLGTGFFHVELFLAQQGKFQAYFTNRVTGEGFPLRFKPFQGIFDDDRVSRGELTFAGAESRTSADLSSVIAHYVGEWFDADVYYLVRQGDHFLQKHLVFRNVRTPVRLRRVSLFTHVLMEDYEPVLHEAGMFYPVLFYRGKRGGLFFCADFPCYFAELEDRNFRFDYYPSVPLHPGRSFQSLSAVVGVYPLTGVGYANRYHEKGAWLDAGERVWFRAFLERNLTFKELPYVEIKGPELGAGGPSDLEILEQCSWFGARHVFQPTVSFHPDNYPMLDTIEQAVRQQGLSPKFLWSRGDAENLKWVSVDLGVGSELPESRAYFSVDAFREQLVEQHLSNMEKHGFREVEVAGVPILPYYSARRVSWDLFERREMLHEAFQRFADVTAALKETFSHVSGTGAYRCYGAGLIRLFDSVGANAESYPLAIPDLHLGRLYADSERFAFCYAHDFLLPKSFLWNSVGFPHDDTVSHVFPGCVQYPWYLYHDRAGWRYALISALATGLRHRFYPVPMDFPEEDRMFARWWLNWERENVGLLRETEPLFGEPALGKVDGYFCFREQRGFIFLFNGSYDEQYAAVPLHLPKGIYEVREIYPEVFRHRGTIGGYYSHRARLNIRMRPREAKILEINQRKNEEAAVHVFGAPSVLEGSTLTLRGEPGTALTVGIRAGDKYKTIRVRFKGERVRRHITDWRYVISPYEQGREKFATGDFQGNRLTENFGTMHNVWLRSRFRLPADFAKGLDTSPFRLSQPCWTYEDRLFFVIRFEPAPVFDTIRTGSDFEDVPESFSAEQHMKTGIDLASWNIDLRAWVNGRQCAVYPLVAYWGKLKPNPAPVIGFFFEAGSKCYFGETNSVVLFARNFDASSFRGIYMENLPDTVVQETLNLSGVFAV